MRWRMVGVLIVVVLVLMAAYFTPHDPFDGMAI